MTRLELRRYNGQWTNRGVIQRVRRTIAARVRMGECVLVDGEGLAGLTRADWESICGGLPADKVKIIQPAATVFAAPGPRHPA